MNNRGVTLIELMVVVAIVGILIIALAFSYQGWQGRYKVEGATRNLYTDLMNARAQAMQRATTFFVDFPSTTTYRMSIDDSNGTDKTHGGDGTFQPQADDAAPTIDTDTTQPTFRKNVTPYTISGGVLLTFDSKGLMYSGSPAVLIANPLTISLTSTANPDYDCVRIESTRINAGQMQGGVCNVK
jgi:prepilin-type N-terminal cleavage/methylation domain-containing protein